MKLTDLKESDMEGKQLPLAEFVQTHIVNVSDPAAEIQKLEPPFLGYRKLLALLPVYEGYAKQDDGQKLVKSIFPNPEYVYLHGTDVPELFSQDVRDFSHGCIRVRTSVPGCCETIPAGIWSR